VKILRKGKGGNRVTGRKKVLGMTISFGFFWRSWQKGDKKKGEGHVTRFTAK